MFKPAELLGKTFARWTVLRKSRSTPHGTYWVVQCSCGSVGEVKSYALRSGLSRSCGCLQREVARKHGLRDHPLYNTHRLMMSRCYDDQDPNYKDYGARGILVCDRWHDLRNYVSDVPEKPFAEAQLDRIENDGNYEPGNVRWVTGKQNCRNRRGNVMVEHDGRVMTLAEKSEITGIPYSTLYGKIWKARNANN